MTDVKKPWQTIRKRARIIETGKQRLRIHDLRHSFASAARNAKVPLEELGSLMGHSRIETTMRYAHLYDDTKREAANKVGSLLAGLLPSKPKRPAKRKLKVVAGGKR